MISLCSTVRDPGELPNAPGATSATGGIPRSSGAGMPLPVSQITLKAEGNRHRVVLRIR